MELQPQVISVSQVSAYLACPLKYRFQYVDKIPRPWRAAGMAFGTSVHAAVEWFHKARMFGRSPEVADVLKIFEGDWYAQNVEPLVFSERESKDSLTEKAKAMLQLYVESVNGVMPVAVEQPGEVWDVRLRGIIDLVEEDETLVDLKTAGRTLEAGGLERHLQLSTYALAYSLLHGRIPKLRLDMLLKTIKPRLERYPTSRSLEDLSWTAQLIREAALAIQTEHFFPNPSWRCTECEYFAHCQQWRGYEAPRDGRVIPIESLTEKGVGESVGA